MTSENKHPIKVHSFGCRLNAYEAEFIQQQLKETVHNEPLLVINTCAVTAQAEKDGIKAILKMKAQSPQSKVVVTGCSAHLHPESYHEVADLWVDNSNKMNPQIWKNLEFGKSWKQPAHIEGVLSTDEQLLRTAFSSQTRGFVQIQQGCDHRCTFCIIPYARGDSVSISWEKIKRQIEIFVQQGVNEIVLTGVDLSSYGQELKEKQTLGSLVQRILATFPELPRLRLSSIDAIEIDNDLRDCFKNEKRLMPYLHLSLQAGDNMILKRMKRRHSREEAVQLCQELRELRPEMTFGADLIAGFPTESDAMFQNTLALLEDCDIQFLHAFTYSERPGTPAARMPQVELSIRRARAAQLREKGEQRRSAFLKTLVNTEQLCLLEKRQGRTEQFVPIDLAIPEALVGKILPVHVKEFRDGRLYGELAAPR